MVHLTQNISGGPLKRNKSGGGALAFGHMPKATTRR